MCNKVFLFVCLLNPFPGLFGIMTKNTKPISGLQGCGNKFFKHIYVLNTNVVVGAWNNGLSFVQLIQSANLNKCWATCKIKI